MSFGKALRGELGAQLPQVNAQRIDGRNSRRYQRWRRGDGIVAHHTADFFDQIVFDRNIFGGAPAWHDDRQDGRRGFGDGETEGRENVGCLRLRNIFAELAG